MKLTYLIIILAVVLIAVFLLPVIIKRIKTEKEIQNYDKNIKPMSDLIFKKKNK